MLFDLGCFKRSLDKNKCGQEMDCDPVYQLLINLTKKEITHHEELNERLPKRSAAEEQSWLKRKFDKRMVSVCVNRA